MCTRLKYVPDWAARTHNAQDCRQLAKLNEQLEDAEEYENLARYWKGIPKARSQKFAADQSHYAMTIMMMMHNPYYVIIMIVHHPGNDFFKAVLQGIHRQCSPRCGYRRCKSRKMIGQFRSGVVFKWSK